MVDRRTRLLDAGVELVADHGPGGLTHDAVDAHAGQPSGSTEEWFPTARALLEGVTHGWRVA
jgi:DNA-binding transcriptional regulator YbjK